MQESHTEGREAVQLSVGELADRGQVSRRTVRFYVQRGLLPPPHGGGRGSYYDEGHLARLIAIRQLQESGVPLDEVALRLEGGVLAASPVRAERAEPTAPASETWRRLAIAPGLELMVRDGDYDPRTVSAIVQLGQALIAQQRQLLAASKAETATVSTPSSGEREEGE